MVFLSCPEIIDSCCRTNIERRGGDENPAERWQILQTGVIATIHEE